VLANFSFRGPTPAPVADLTKPDITGPGVIILAAGRAADGNYFTISGTSMSSPHLAGSAALVRAVSRPGRHRK
jgi:subtilisin family serine protease